MIKGSDIQTSVPIFEMTYFYIHKNFIIKVTIMQPMVLNRFDNKIECLKYFLLNLKTGMKLISLK